MIRVQQEDFDVGAEIAALGDGNRAVGGIASFVGLVRDLSDGARISRMTLEHFPGMTEQALTDIETEARTRWPLEAVTIIHRYGPLDPGDRIVLVAVASSHREAAFAACHFIMDWLKTRAPFWKLEDTGAGARWVEAKDSDDQAAARWAEK